MTYYAIGAPKVIKNASPVKCCIVFKSRLGRQYFHLLDYQWIYMVTVLGVIHTYFMLQRSAID